MSTHLHHFEGGLFGSHRMPRFTPHLFIWSVLIALSLVCLAWGLATLFTVDVSFLAGLTPFQGVMMVLIGIVCLVYASLGVRYFDNHHHENTAAHD